MPSLERLNVRVNTFLAWLSVLALVGAIVVVVGNMFLRMFWRPFEGTFEVTGWLVALTTAFGFGYTQVHRGHVAIDLLVARLPGRYRDAIEAVVSLLAGFMFGLLTWRLAVYATQLGAAGSLSETLRVSYVPVVYAVALACGGLSVALMVDCLAALRRILERGSGGRATPSG